MDSQLIESSRSAEEALAVQDENTDAPPSYSEVLGQISDRNENGATNAAIAQDGRVDITIDHRSRRLSTILGHVVKTSVGHESPPPEPYIPPSLGGPADGVPPPSMNVVIHVVGSRGMLFAAPLCLK